MSNEAFRHLPGRGVCEGNFPFEHGAGLSPHLRTTPKENEWLQHMQNAKSAESVSYATSFDFRIFLSRGLLVSTFRWSSIASITAQNRERWEREHARVMEAQQIFLDRGVKEEARVRVAKVRGHTGRAR